MKKARSSIKIRIVSILCAVLICSIAVSVVSAYRFFWPSFQAIEQDLAEQNAMRIRNAILNDVRTLGVFASDWALWDDSYEFIRDPGEDYIISNLDPETFWQNSLAGVAYLNQQGEAVWAKSYDFRSDDLVAFQPDALSYVNGILASGRGLPADGLFGIINTADGYFFLAARAIRDSRVTLPPNGALVMLRQMDEDYFDRLRLDMGIYFRADPIALQEAGPEQRSNILADDVRTVWFDLPLLNDTRDLRFFVEMSRAVSATAERAMTGNVAAVALGSLTVFLVMLIALEIQVVRPLLLLSRGLIQRQKDPMARIEMDRMHNDEIGLIAQEVDRLQARIIEMALQDDLTGLPNRRLFDDRLEQAVERAIRRHSYVAVIFIDLDGFKPVNDKYGHQEGDRVLQKIAERFGCVVRGSDTMARLGGDEFAMVAEFRKDARIGVEVLCRKLMQQLERPFAVREDLVRISASIGCSIFPDQAHDMAELVRMADEAMYRIKNSGKAGWMIHGEDEEPHRGGGGDPRLPRHAIR